MDGFKVLHHSDGNDLLHTVLHTPLLPPKPIIYFLSELRADRDFLVFHVVLKLTEGRGLMFYSRSATRHLASRLKMPRSPPKSTEFH